MSKNLEIYRDQSNENLKEAQNKQKRWYDQQAHLCQLQPETVVAVTHLNQQAFSKVARALQHYKVNGTSTLQNT